VGPSSSSHLSSQRTSRQLRAEYLPIYLRATTIGIGWDDVEWFQHNFYESTEVAGAIPRNLRIQMRNRLNEYQHLHEEITCIHLLLKMRALRMSIIIRYALTHFIHAMLK
jgi:hypothetical protein